MTHILRAIAILVAVAALIDPAFDVRREAPPQLDVRLGRGVQSNPEAQALRARILDAHGTAGTGDPARPAAVVLIGATADDMDGLPEGVPVSIVNMEAPVNGPRLAGASAPERVLPGQMATIGVDVDLPPASGNSALVSIEQDGVELASATVKVAGEARRASARLAYAPPATGLHHLRVTVRDAGAADRRQADGVDVGFVAEARELRVMTYEPRPSWAAAFVRRAIEADPAFVSSAFARASRSVAVSAGAPPRVLTADALDAYDAVIVGAPEALARTEVQALETFARVRGGAVVLLPDRRPSGPYAGLLGIKTFDEVLVETPIALDVPTGRGPGATELAIPRGLPAGCAAIASARLQGRELPAIISCAAGAGRIVFSGALDAWRYRAEEDDAFGRYWTSVVASIAAAAPRAIDVVVAQPVMAPGDRIDVRAAIRRTEWREGGGVTELPRISAVLIAGDGSQQPVRLWPAAATGEFAGRSTAGPPGRYTVRVTSGDLAAETPLLVAEGIRPPEPPVAPAQRAVAATGGVAVNTADLAPLDRHLAGLPRGEVRAKIAPMRSAWWMVVFAGTLAGEWTLRRRRGLR